jgi:hypothetical protein
MTPAKRRSRYCRLNNIGMRNISNIEAGLRELNELRQGARTCVMCSEAVWWRRHRRMIADAETGARHSGAAHHERDGGQAA